MATVLFWVINLALLALLLLLFGEVGSAIWIVCHVALQFLILDSHVKVALLAGAFTGGIVGAVVGLAAPSSAHHNTITGYVACRTGGGWDVTWRVVNSEQRTETITASSRPSVVPVGTVLGHNEAKIFAEAVMTKPVSAVTLTLSARWSNGVTQTSSGSIPASSFADKCSTKKVSAPTVPVVDDCGPGNAHYGTVPAGPWTSGRQLGAVTSTARPLPATSKPSADRILRLSPSAMARPDRRGMRAKSKEKVERPAGGSPATRALEGLPPASFTIVSVARSSPGRTNSGSTPRSKR